MVKATHPTAEKIAVAFDFDDTLVPSTYDGFIKYLGMDAAEFRQQVYDPLKADGWDPISARFYSFINYSKSRSNPSEKITRETIREFGQSLQPFAGVTDMFHRLQAAATAIAPQVEVEFYLITSGFVEMARSSPIADCFKAMWGPEFHYSESGEIEFLKRSLDHPAKPRYLYYIAKGVRDDESRDDILFVYEDVPPAELAIPLPQVIYVGDGNSDIPCFAMLNREGGTAIGVYTEGSAQQWADHYQPSQGERVSNLASADYRAGSELMKSLTLAVEGICKKIQLRQLSIAE
ncbi:MAG: HAD family hydrolase [Cyanobacteria bacterium J06626_4]